MSELNLSGENGATLSKENWPDWLLKQYGNLPLPSLFDYLVVQEKLAAELRKQNKEMRSFAQEMGQLKSRVSHLDEQIAGLCSLSQCKENFEDHSTLSESHASQLLIESMDGLLNLLNANRKTAKTILEAVPEAKNLWTRRKPSWRLRLEEILSGYSSGVETLQKKIEHSLSELDITLIAPEEGDHFQPQLHKAVATCSGGENGTVAEVIRYGYFKNLEILRCAEVSIYQNLRINHE